VKELKARSFIGNYQKRVYCGKRTHYICFYAYVKGFLS